ncbi:MAG: hypothetical protein AAF658_22065, partial [Myxococcota bacterium]
MSGDAKLPAVVVLPWAQHAFDPEAGKLLESERVAQDAQALQVDADQLQVGDPPSILPRLESIQKKRNE